MGFQYSLPLLLPPFVLMVMYRRPILEALEKIRLPKFALALLVSVPLIIYEERINCGAYGCTSDIVPPTLIFVFGMVLLMLLLMRVVPIKRVYWQLTFLSVLGFLFEFFLGAAHLEMQQFMYAHPFWFVVIALWTGFSYAFVLYLPLLILKNSGHITAS